jgi:hypothetical protein
VKTIAERAIWNIIVCTVGTQPYLSAVIGSHDNQLKRLRPQQRARSVDIARIRRVAMFGMYPIRIHNYDC